MTDAIFIANETARHLKILKRRYNSWCNWNAKWEIYWAAFLDAAPKDAEGNVDWEAIRELGRQRRDVPCSVPYPKGRPSKNSKYSAYSACHFLRNQYEIEMDKDDYGTVREWRNVLIAMGVRNVKPLPKCNEKKH